MSGALDKVKDTAATARRRTPFVEHIVEMVQHYGRVDGSVLAGGITYFAFLSFFPLLALAFAIVGFVSGVYPAARDALTTALQDAFPGIIETSCGAAAGCVELSTFEDAAGTATVLGILGLLYAGLGWLSGLRTALAAVFDIPRDQRRNVVVAKLVDLAALAVLGVTLLVSVAFSGGVSSAIPWLVDLVGLDGVPGIEVLFGAVGVVLGLASSTALFLVMFRLLADEATVPGRHRLQGALLAGTGFEALKLVATALVAGALGNPAFATLGVSLVLVVWMNYFSRLVIFGASWAAVAGEVRRALGKEEPTAEPLDPPPLADAVPVPAGAGPYGVQPGGRGAFARGLVSGAGLAVVVWALTGRRR